jgi:hypothetical protein
VEDKIIAEYLVKKCFCCMMQNLIDEAQAVADQVDKLLLKLSKENNHDDHLNDIKQEFFGFKQSIKMKAEQIKKQQ